MSGSNFNLRDKLSSNLPSKTLQVFSLSDLPAASGGFRDFDLDEGISLRAPIVDANAWRWPDVSTIYIVSPNINTSTLTYAGAAGTTFLNCVGQVRGLNLDLIVFVSVFGAQLIDVTADVRGTRAYGITDIIAINFLGGAIFRNFNGGPVNGLLLAGITEGLRFENCGINQLNGVSLLGSGIGGKSLLSYYGPFTLQTRIDAANYATGGLQSGIDIGANMVPIAPISAVDTALNNVFGGTYFKPVVNIAFSEVAFFPILGTVGSVTDEGGFALFNLSGGFPRVGDFLVHSGFTEASYNGFFFVTRVNGTASYQIARFTVLPMITISFVPASDSTGTFAAPAITITSSDNSRVVPGNAIRINSGNHVGTHTVRSKSGPFDFIVFAAFNGTEAGSFDTFSLTETDPQVDIVRAGTQKASMVAGGWTVTGNTTETLTTAAVGAFQDIKFDSAPASPFSFNERITLINNLIGTIRYDGVNPVVMRIPLEMFLAPVGNQPRVYSFVLVIDRGSGFVVLPDIVGTLIEMTGTGTDVQFTTFRDVLMNPGDLVKWQVANFTNIDQPFVAQEAFSAVGKA